MVWMLLFYGYLLAGLALAVYVYCSLAFLVARAEDPDEQDREMLDEMDGLAEGLRSLFG